MFRAARACPPLWLVLLAAGLAFAGPATPSKEASAGAKARAALPAPQEGNGLAYEGEVWSSDGVFAGTVRLKAEAGVFAEKPAWLVTEDVFWDLGVEWRLGASYTLLRDLTFVRGEIERRQKDEITRWTVARSADGVSGTRQVVRGEVEGPLEDVAWKTPPDAMAGLTALALFLRGPLPAGEKAFRVTWMDNEWGYSGPARATAISLALEPDAEFTAAPGKPKVLAVAVGGSVEAIGRLALDPQDRSLLGLEGLGLGSLGTATVLPKGTRPAGAKFDEKAPARTWQDAFLKFGIGYHMAREDVLDSAFHWPSMYAYETSLVDGWPSEKPLAEFRKAWLAAFLAESKHRPRHEADELLRMTLATGRLEAKSEDRVLFHAHKNFGGGIQRDYHLKRIDGLWYLVRIDINE